MQKTQPRHISDNVLTWKTLRLLIIGSIIVGNIWLFYWVMPSMGCFRLAGHNTLVDGTTFSLVYFVDGEYTSIFSLNSVRIGWSIVKDVWPMILFGAMIGYPVGEFVKWRCSLETISDIMQEKKGMFSLEMFIREAKVRSMVEKANARTEALPKVQERVKEQQAELFQLKTMTAERKKDHVEALRKVKTLENELHKSRAQIRRLKKKCAQ